MGRNWVLHGLGNRHSWLLMHLHRMLARCAWWKRWCTFFNKYHFFSLIEDSVGGVQTGCKCIGSSRWTCDICPKRSSAKTYPKSSLINITHKLKVWSEGLAPPFLQGIRWRQNRIVHWKEHHIPDNWRTLSRTLFGGKVDLPNTSKNVGYGAKIISL